MRSDYLNENSQQTGSWKKKVITLAAENKTLTEADSGKVFFVNQSAAYDITLPATSIAGWNAKSIRINSFVELWELSLKGSSRIY